MEAQHAILEKTTPQEKHNGMCYDCCNFLDVREGGQAEINLDGRRG